MIAPGQPSGLESILAALATGGKPVGQMGKQPIGINPSTMTQGPTGEVGLRSIQPTAMDYLSMQGIIKGLSGSGIFNPGGGVVG